MDLFTFPIEIIDLIFYYCSQNSTNHSFVRFQYQLSSQTSQFNYFEYTGQMANHQPNGYGNKLG